LRDPENPGQHTGFILSQLGGRDTEDRQASLLHPAVAVDVLLAAVGVIGAVEFDDEADLGAEEIGEEWAEGVLAAELVAADFAVAQAGPEDLLGDGLVSAEAGGLVLRAGGAGDGLGEVGLGGGGVGHGWSVMEGKEIRKGEDGRREGLVGRWVEGGALTPALSRRPPRREREGGRRTYYCGPWPRNRAF
jgi:hypothetical protein